MSTPAKRGVEAARKNLPVLLDQAHRGRTIVITKHGKPFAAIVGIDRTPQKSGLSLTRLRGTGKGQWGPSSAQWLKRLRAEW
jgi:prevent-host-death family protein